MLDLLQPYFLFGIIPVVILVVFLYFKNKNHQFFHFYSDISQIYKQSSKYYFLNFVFLFFIAAVSLLIISQPVLINQKEKISKQGRDIVIVLDISRSMLAKDLKPNRLESAKKIISQFISQLESDRLGFVVFAGKPFTSLPLNFDYEVSQQIISQIDTDTISQDIGGLGGTSIGDAIIFAADLFEDSNREKAIVLLTDGTANSGVDPIVASKYVEELGLKKPIKIYTIGIGGDKPAFIDYRHPMGFLQTLQVEAVDEKTLQSIATMNNGKYFRADSNFVFQKIFDEISQLETSKIEAEIFKTSQSIAKYFVYILGAILIFYFVFRIRKKL